MVSKEPDVRINGRYSIEETCTALGLHRNTLRRYTAHGKIRFGIRRADSRKFYLGSEILRFWRAQI